MGWLCCLERTICQDCLYFFISGWEGVVITGRKRENISAVAAKLAGSERMPDGEDRTGFSNLTGVNIVATPMGDDNRITLPTERQRKVETILRISVNHCF